MLDVQTPTDPKQLSEQYAESIRREIARIATIATAFPKHEAQKGVGIWLAREYPRLSRFFQQHHYVSDGRVLGSHAFGRLGFDAYLLRRNS